MAIRQPIRTIVHTHILSTQIMIDTNTDTSQGSLSDTPSSTMSATVLSSLHCAPHAALLASEALEATMHESLSNWQTTLHNDDNAVDNKVDNQDADIVDLMQLDEGTAPTPLQATSITRNYGFNDFHQTMAFVRAISAVIHREDHHPTLLVSFKECRLTYSTHDAGGVTLNDLICAAKCDVIFDAHRAKSVG